MHGITNNYQGAPALGAQLLCTSVQVQHSAVHHVVQEAAVVLGQAGTIEFMRGDGWRGTKLTCARLNVAWLVLSLALCSGIGVRALAVQGAGP